MAPSQANEKSPRIQISNNAAARSSFNRESETTPTFHQFPQLPAELRLKIWQYTFLPRVLNIIPVFSQQKKKREKCMDCEPYHNRGAIYNGGCLSTCLPPIALHICRESRYEALKTYVLSFGWSLDTEDRSTLTLYEPTIYFDPDLDIVYFDLTEAYAALWESFTLSTDLQILSKIRYLCLTGDHPDMYLVEDLGWFLQGFSNLELLYLVREHDGKSVFSNSVKWLHLPREKWLDDVRPEHMGAWTSLDPSVMWNIAHELELFLQRREKEKMAE